jgi:hypothetical protein
MPESGPQRIGPAGLGRPAKQLIGIGTTGPGPWAAVPVADVSASGLGLHSLP